MQDAWQHWQKNDQPCQIHCRPLLLVGSQKHSMSSAHREQGSAVACAVGRTADNIAMHANNFQVSEHARPEAASSAAGMSCMQDLCY